MVDDIDPRCNTIVTHMSVPDYPGLYVVGSLENRVTIYSQQVRALNLIYSLFEKKLLDRTKKVCVVGAGFAGITAAVGTAIHGCKVTVLEKKSTYLNIQQGSFARWIHPHIYDWPKNGSEIPEANLPLLNWKADSAGNLVTKLLKQWEVYASDHPITRIPCVQNILINPPGDQRGLSVTYQQNNVPITTPFDVVLLCVGFGMELGPPEYPVHSYWRNEDFNQAILENDPKSYLISGTGDGGLVDALRLRIQDFQHDTFLSEMFKDDRTQVRKHLLEYEDQIVANHKEWTNQRLTEAYKTLPVSPKMIDALKEKLRSDTIVYLNSRDPFPLSITTSISNRFAISVLLEIDERLKYLPGPLNDVIQKDDRGHSLAVIIDGEQKPVDQVVIRHGPGRLEESIIAKDFPVIYEKIAPAADKLRELDQTREPIWKMGFFQNTSTIDLDFLDDTQLHIRKLIREKLLGASDKFYEDAQVILKKDVSTKIHMAAQLMHLVFCELDKYNAIIFSQPQQNQNLQKVSRLKKLTQLYRDQFSRISHDPGLRSGDDREDFHNADNLLLEVLSIEAVDSSSPDHEGAH